MKINTRYLGNKKFEISARGHRAICDQPANGGQDAGMTPPEFLLASLGACAAYYAAEYLNTRGLPATDLTVEVTAEKVRQPTRIGSFQIQVSVPGLEQRHQEGVLRAVKSCLIHNTLLNAPRIELAVNCEVPAMA